MSLKGLRFTLEVDGQEPDTFAVVNFRLIQNQSYPFVMSVDVASDSFMQTAANNLYYLNRPVKVRIRISGEVINISLNISPDF